MRKLMASRKRNQADYQRRYRQQQTSHRKPSRDDVARAALHWIIVRCLKQENEGQLGKWTECVSTLQKKHDALEGWALIQSFCLPKTNDDRQSGQASVTKQAIIEMQPARRMTFSDFQTMLSIEGSATVSG